MRILLLATALAFLPVQTLAAAQADSETEPARTPFRVPRVDSGPRIDGVLDDEVWRQALVLELRYEFNPGENTAPPVRTEVWLAYGTSHLWVAFRAWDPEPAAIVARLSDRDRIEADDWVAIALDTFNDERRAYVFYCNPFGIQADQLLGPEGPSDVWDAIWDSAGRITAAGFAVEMAIPFSSLRFQRTPSDQIWGVDAFRSYPRNLPHEIGLFPRQRGNNCWLCQAEKLIGFAGVRPGHNVELDPTFSAVHTEEREHGTTGAFIERDRRSDFGLTGHWGFTSNLTLTATVNPDFSQVEADAAQLDVNIRFALDFPEKRPFFLEGIDFFNTRMRAVYTRTVAEPQWGLKLTGKEGPHAIGLFVVEDGITNLLFPGNQGSRGTSLPIGNTSSVLRYRRDVGLASTLGVLITDREGGDYSNRLLGVDGDYKITPRDRIRFQFLTSRTRYPDSVAADYDQPQGEFDGAALEVHYQHEGRNVGWYARHTRMDPDFRADSGFIPQADYNRSRAGASYAWWRDPGHWFTWIRLHSAYQEERDDDGNELYQEGSFSINYSGPYRSSINVNQVFATRTFAGIEFEYDFVEFYNWFWPSGNLYLELDGRIGDEIHYATRRQARQVLLMPKIEYRLGRRLTFRFDHTFERLDVEGDHLYDANVSRLKTVYQFSRQAFLRAILQLVDYKYYTAEPRFKHFFSQLLFSYKINPQTVLFLGYSDNHLPDEDLHLTQVDRTVFFKVGYAWVL